MKSFLLFSSIFYLLGLKIGHKIDLFKNHNPIEKISTTTNTLKEVTKSVHYNDEVKLKIDTDSLKNTSVMDKIKKEENNL